MWPACDRGRGSSRCTCPSCSVAVTVDVLPGLTVAPVPAAFDSDAVIHARLRRVLHDQRDLAGLSRWSVERVKRSAPPGSALRWMTWPLPAGAAAGVLAGAGADAVEVVRRRAAGQQSHADDGDTDDGEESGHTVTVAGSRYLSPVDIGRGTSSRHLLTRERVTRYPGRWPRSPHSGRGDPRRRRRRRSGDPGHHRRPGIARGQAATRVTRPSAVTPDLTDQVITGGPPRRRDWITACSARSLAGRAGEAVDARRPDRDSDAWPLIRRHFALDPGQRRRCRPARSRPT